CGVGGDTVVFLKHGFDVYACDILYSKIKYLKINSSIYKKEQDKKYIYGNLSCEVSDFLTLNVDRKYEYGFLSPPWGGMDYKNSALFDLYSIDFDKITTKSQSIIKNCVYFLPKNCNPRQIEDIIKDSITVNIMFQERILGLVVFHGDDFLANKEAICLAFK
ncbi:RNA cap guanine-N2 methyltransferase, partial [Hamiltosporidium magnivora]